MGLAPLWVWPIQILLLLLMVHTTLVVVVEPTAEVKVLRVLFHMAEAAVLMEETAVTGMALLFSLQLKTQ